MFEASPATRTVIFDLQRTGREFRRDSLGKNFRTFGNGRYAVPEGNASSALSAKCLGGGAYAKALAGGRRDGKEGGLAPRTVGHMHRVFKQALSQAIRWELLNRNPADAVDPPKVEWRPVSTYDLPQTVNVIEAVRGKPIYIPVLLAALCGLRCVGFAVARY